MGCVGAIAAAALAGPPPVRLRIRRVAAAALMIMILFHGFRMPAEAAIRTMAAEMWPLSYCRWECRV